MKNKKYTQILVLVLILFANLNGHGQEKLKTTGYLGKKTTVEFNLGTSYGLSTDLENDAYKNERIFRPSIHPELTVAYTVKRNMDIGFKVGYDRVKVRFDNELDFEVSNERYYPNLTPNSNNEVNKQYFQIIDRDNVGVSFNYQMFVRVYSSKYVAPVGAYHQLSAGINSVSFKDSEIEGYMSDRSLSSRSSDDFIANSTTDPLIIKLRKFNMFDLSYMFGNKKIYKNGFYSNIGVEFNIFGKRALKSGDISILEFIPLGDLLYNPEEKNQNSESYHYHYPKQLAKSIQRSQLIEFKIGIGKIF